MHSFTCLSAAEGSRPAHQATTPRPGLLGADRGQGGWPWQGAQRRCGTEDAFSCLDIFDSRYSHFPIQKLQRRQSLSLRGSGHIPLNRQPRQKRLYLRRFRSGPDGVCRGKGGIVSLITDTPARCASGSASKQSDHSIAPIASEGGKRGIRSGIMDMIDVTGQCGP